MDNSPEQPLRASDFEAAIAEARAVAREQVLAAWQLHIDRVREQLEGGWRESVDQIFDERFAEVESRLRVGFDEAVAAQAGRQLGEAADAARVEARRALTAALNQTVRQLKNADSRDIWIRTVLDAAAPFCSKAALFLLTPRGLKLEGAHGAAPPESVAAAEIPLSSAPAFAAAIESKDTVVADGSAKELSQTVAALLGDAAGQRVYLFPVIVRQSAVAVLYAEPAGADTIDTGALELLVSLASDSIGTTESVTVTAPPAAGLVRIAGASAPEAPKAAAKPSWSDLSKADQEQHLKAQRFARSAVAQVLLHRVHQVRTGRASNNLYESLRGEMDAGREAFRQQFVETCPSMVDYYHLEVLRTLARDDAGALGPDYPGPLVR